MIQLSMIVEITSWVPTVAFRIPAMPASRAPASTPATTASRMWTRPGRPGSSEPTQTPMIAPARYWPWPPMLNMPQRNAKATASPVRTSGTKLISVCWRLYAASDSMSFDVPRERNVRVRERDPELVGADLEEPVHPRALEDRLVGRERVLAGRGEHDEAADQEREDHRQQRHDDSAGLLCERIARREARRRRPRPCRRPRAGGGAPARSLTPPSARRRSSRRRAPLRRRRAGTRRRFAPRR